MHGAEIMRCKLDSNLTTHVDFENEREPRGRQQCFMREARETTKTPIHSHLNCGIEKGAVARQGSIQAVCSEVCRESQLVDITTVRHG